MRRKLPTLLWTIFLKFAALFHRVVATMHEIVVPRSIRTRHARSVRDYTKRLRDEVRALLARQAQHLGKPRGDHVERLARDPHAILRRIDVGEETKNPVAVGRARREGIDVRQIVART